MGGVGDELLLQPVVTMINIEKKRISMNREEQCFFILKKGLFSALNLAPSNAFYKEDG